MTTPITGQGLNVCIPPDDELSLTSKKAAQNKVITEELTDLSNAIDQKAPVIINTASGDIATFADGADGMPIKHLVASIEAVQSGTGDPSPENIRPISGWTGLNGARTGVNILDPDILTVANNNIRTATNTYIKLKKNTNYYYCSTIPIDGLYVISKGGTTIAQIYNNQQLQFSVSEDTEASLDAYWGSSKLPSGGLSKDMVYLSVGSNTGYAPYQGQTISVSWATEAGTVYGATLDVVTGELTVKQVSEEFDGSSDESWQYFSVAQGNLFRNVSNGRNPTINNINVNQFLCSAYKPAVTRVNETISSSAVGYFDFINNSITDLTAWKAELSLNPVQVIYPLLTPIVYQLDPVTVNTLLSNNTVYVDCGSVTVDYPADTGIVVAEQSNAISQLEGQAVTDVTVTGTIVSITAEANKRYLCGTVASIDVTPCVSGAFDLIFTSGSTAAVLTIPNTVKWQDSSFDPSALDADTTYEISVAEGTLGLVASWT